MSFAAFEDGRATGQPVELYLFTYGPDSNAFIAQCDGDRAVTFGGVTYEPAPLKRGKINSRQSLDKSEFKLLTSLSSPVVELFRLYAPSYPVTLTIRTGHYDDPANEFIVAFVGVVQQSKRGLAGGRQADGQARQAELLCTPESVSMRRPGLRRHYQLSCPHALYQTGDFNCRASKAAATRAAQEITALEYLAVTVESGWNGSFAAEKFVGGMVEWTGDAGPEKRTILRVTGNVLSLNAPTTGLTVGDTVDVVLGCNHQVTDCETLHNNIVNFGGMPYIPGVNPVKTNPFS
jgi:uncharacterized phage protein (TIGR02218 family)